MTPEQFEREKAKAQSLADQADQAWVSYDQYYDAIYRISEGTIALDDFPLIQGIACLVVGELAMRRGNRAMAEMGDKT